MFLILCVHVCDRHVCVYAGVREYKRQEKENHKNERVHAGDKFTQERLHLKARAKKDKKKKRV